MVKLAFIGQYCGMAVSDLQLGDGVVSDDPPTFDPEADVAFVALNATSDIQEFLNGHNKYRCMHGVPPLTWNEDIARLAASWGRTCCESGLKHSQSYSYEPSQGENLAAGYGTIAEALKGWYDEIEYCAKFPGCPKVPGKVVGHFTAMIWKASSTLGCAKTTNGWLGKYPVYVCRYANTPPNYGGQYEANVLQAKKSESQCEGAAPQRAAPSPVPTPQGATYFAGQKGQLCASGKITTLKGCQDAAASKSSWIWKRQSSAPNRPGGCSFQPNNKVVFNTATGKKYKNSTPICARSGLLELSSKEDKAAEGTNIRSTRHHATKLSERMKVEVFPGGHLDFQ